MSMSAYGNIFPAYSQYFNYNTAQECIHAMSQESTKTVYKFFKKAVKQIESENITDPKIIALVDAAKEVVEKNRKELEYGRQKKFKKAKSHYKDYTIRIQHTPNVKEEQETIDSQEAIKQVNEAIVAAERRARQPEARQTTEVEAKQEAIAQVAAAIRRERDEAEAAVAKVRAATQKEAQELAHALHEIEASEQKEARELGNALNQVDAAIAAAERQKQARGNVHNNHGRAVVVSHSNNNNHGQSSSNNHIQNRMPATAKNPIAQTLPEEIKNLSEYTENEYFINAYNFFIDKNEEQVKKIKGDAAATLLFDIFKIERSEKAHSTLKAIGKKILLLCHEDKAKVLGIKEAESLDFLKRFYMFFSHYYLAATER